MVEPERVLHSVMVIAFDRKGVIDPDLKIIQAVLSELRLDQEHADDALDHIRQFRGDGDWSGKRDSILNVAISRIEEGIADGALNNSGIIGALKRLIESTKVNSDSDDDSLAAFEEEYEDSELAALESDSPSGDDEAQSTEFSIEDSSESIDGAEDEDDIDPFELLGAGASRESDDSVAGGYTDPLDALMEDDEFEDGPEDALAFSEDESSAAGDDDETSKDDSKDDAASDGDNIIDMYRMMLDTVWVDDLIDPSEVKLLTRKREELGISFETHLRLVREMLEDGE